MKPTVTTTVLETLREVDLDHPDTTYKDVQAAVKKIGAFDKGEVTLTRMRGRSPWERHAKGDELFYVISGGIYFTLLTKTAKRTVDVPAGGIYVVPRGLWHRTRSQRGTVALIVRGCDHGPVTFAADPRRAPKSELID